jgi:tetratricopeptide (TPR) repeat protein
VVETSDRLSGIQYLAVIDLNRSILAHTDPSEIGANFPELGSDPTEIPGEGKVTLVRLQEPPVLDLSLPLTAGGGMAVGRAHLGLSLDRLEWEVQGEILPMVYTFLLLASALMLVGFFGALALKREWSKGNERRAKPLQAGTRKRGLLYVVIAACLLVALAILLKVQERFSGPERSERATPAEKAEIPPFVSETGPFPKETASTHVTPDHEDPPAEPSTSIHHQGPIHGDLQEGTEALGKKGFEAAATSFEQVPADEPAGAAKSPDLHVRDLEGKAATLVAKEPRKAESLLMEALRIDSESVQGYFQLGLVYVQDKNYEKAVEAYEKAAELNPHSPDTFFNLGYVLGAVKDYPRAEQMYERVVALGPPYLDEALFNLAAVQERQGKRAESIRNLERAIEANPQNESAKRLLRKLNRNPGEGR